MAIDGFYAHDIQNLCRVKVTVFRNRLFDCQIFKLDFARYSCYNAKGIHKDSGIETFS